MCNLLYALKTMTHRPLRLTLAAFLAFLFACVAAQAKPVDTKYLSNVPQYVLHESAPGAFRLAAGGTAASILVSGEDWQGVVRARATSAKT